MVKAAHNVINIIYRVVQSSPYLTSSCEDISYTCSYVHYFTSAEKQ